MPATRTGHTYTKAFQIETRQHELLGMDLGEGPARRHLRLAIVVTVLWVLIMIPILRVPNQFTFSLYMIPPGVFIAFGVQMDPRQPRRMRVSGWVLAALYGISGHQPIINMGHRRASRGEQVGWVERLRWEKIKNLSLIRSLRIIVRRWYKMPPPAENVRHTTAEYYGPVGSPIILSGQVKHYGTDYLHDLIAKRANRRKGRRTS